MAVRAVVGIGRGGVSPARPANASRDAVAGEANPAPTNHRTWDVTN